MAEILKQNAEAITAHIEMLKSQSWITDSQRWWPGHIFHFTDLTNAVKILCDGKLLSRSELEKTGGLITDIASPQIISSTVSQWKDYVRLYFRPRTPMQYRNEGFRPTNQRELGAHCPIPVSFIFDAKQILTRQTTRFSDGNLATNASVGDTADFFLSLPFEKIYHDSSLWGISDEEKRRIIFHRHAEVIVPKALDLSSLKYILCRSQAEFETLIHLLPGRVYRKWSKKIGLGIRPLLFFAKWSFIEKADLSTSKISFTFNPSQISGPFQARIEIEEVKTRKIYSWEKDDFYATGSESFSLSNLTQSEHYVVKFWLNGQLAYQNRYDDSELPF